MDWYYPVLTGAVGREGRRHLAGRWDEFVAERPGLRCVADNFWVTAAETAECAMAVNGGLSRRGRETTVLDPAPPRR